jgi:hypothetical protein
LTTPWINHCIWLIYCQLTTTPWINQTRTWICCTWILSSIPREREREREREKEADCNSIKKANKE